MLVGREPERRVIRSLLAAARVGESAILLLVGEAGIGKTALLDDAASGATGMRTLRATGTEAESDVPFGALLQLLRPALVHLDRIPSPQSDALASALALRPGTGGDRFAIGAATLSLISRFAEDEPVALLVDDAHLLDQPSAQALIFAARRLRADPVAVLATVRDGHPGPVTRADLPELRVGGLSLAATGELLATGGRHLGDHAVARLHDITGGNPLALVELADDADGPGTPPPDVPVPVPASLARTFARRADQLSEGARTALVVAAASGGDLALVTRACRELGIQAGALDEAENAALVRVETDTIVFRHPLVRSAVYSDAAAGTRRVVHGALASALPEHAADRRAWHAAEATLGPDEDIARALDSVGRRARDRSAHAVAAGAFERAARLSPDSNDRAPRLVAAGESAWQAGMGEHAVAMLTEASDLGPPPALRARAAGVRGTIAARTGSVEAARDDFIAAGTEIADTDPDAAIMLLGDAILTCFFLGDMSTVLGAAELIDRLVARAQSEPARLVAAVAGGVAGVLTGRGGLDRVRLAVQQVASAGDLVQDLRIAPWLVIGPLFLRESETGRDLVETVVASLRRRSVVGGLPFLLFHVGRDQSTTDRWDVAEVTYSEGIHLAREAGHACDLAACLAGLAWLEARQGRETRCREHADEALQICSTRHISLFTAWSLFAKGELELGLGNAGAALVHLDRLDTLLGHLGLVDVDLSPAPERVDALMRVGRDDAAREAAAGYADRAESKGQPWARARAARAIAVTRPDAEIDQHFAHALGHHAQTLDSFELARTQLAYGASLRRARRRVDARAPLRDALATFETLGAAPWADQAAVELGATGETARRRGASALDELTPQELQIAHLLAGGRTTKEAAAALFISPKTVEYHLRHVYLKLAIRSRAELTDRLDARS